MGRVLLSGLILPRTEVSADKKLSERFRKVTPKPTVFKSIFFSGILHVFLFTAFAFSFTPKPFKSKPFFLFLGSILQKQDFMTAYDDRSLDPLDINMSAIRAIPREENKVSSIISLSKPALSTGLKTQGKTPWKPFLTKEMEDKAGGFKSPSLKNLGISPEVPAYVPLRIYSP